MTDKHHRANIRASKQLVAILGRELIDENAVGLLELVKNSYDADATNVEVGLHNLGEPEKTQIVVHDNGFGMDLKDILERWLVAGYSRKADEKRASQTTPMGRLPLGQMGIGRFATARIGRRLVVASRKADSPEIVFEIEWDDFQGEGDVNEVDLDIVEREPQLFREGATGTRIVMLGAPEPWSREDVVSVQRKLMRLISPFKTVDDFTVSFACPEYPELERIEPEKIFNKYHYRIIADVRADGIAALQWENALLGTGLSEQIDVDLWAKIRRSYFMRPKFGLANRPPECGGPFRVEIRAWKLRNAELDRVGVKDKKTIQELSGVSVFRDSFRVLPYGEPGNDWLDLNKRRVNNPTEKFSTNTIVGMVHIGTKENPDLLDQANRLGLVQNTAFRDFRELTIAVLGELELRTIADGVEQWYPGWQPKGPELASAEPGDERAALVPNYVGTETYIPETDEEQAAGYQTIGVDTGETDTGKSKKSASPSVQKADAVAARLRSLEAELRTLAGQVSAERVRRHIDLASGEVRLASYALAEEAAK